MTNLISMDVEVECLHYDDDGCSIGKKCPLFKYCAEGYLLLPSCNFEVCYEPPDPGSRECAPSGPYIEVIRGEFRGEDIIDNLPDDIEEWIIECLLNKMEEYIDNRREEAMFTAYEDEMNDDDVCPEYFDGH